MKKNFELLVENNNGNFDFYGYDFVTRKSEHEVADYFAPMVRKKFKEDFENPDFIGLTLVGEYIPSLKMFRVETIKHIFEIWDEEDNVIRENPIYELDMDLRLFR